MTLLQTIIIFSYLLLFKKVFAVEIYVIQAEDGTLEGDLTIKTSKIGYSGSGYVGNFPNPTDKLTLDLPFQDGGFYTLKLRYFTYGGDKTCTVQINNEKVLDAILPFSDEFTDSTEFILPNLPSGSKTLSIVGNWGWFELDKLEMASWEVEPHNYDNIDDLINKQSDSVTRELYDYLRQQIYGNRIVSGHTIDRSNDLSELIGKKPALLAYDIAEYSPKYPYDWDNGHVFGPVDNGLIENIIREYEDSNGMLIVSIQWHWPSPSGADTPGTNTFYTQYTTFDVSEAVKIEQTTQYDEIIRDIDAISVQLKRLESAGVPVLWRPLHEADGAWFWWGAMGKDSCLKLWDIMYDRMINHHSLSNLIWVWSRSNTDDWYPGNEKVDIYALDSYPGAFNYATRFYEFHTMYQTVEGEKMLAVSENGPIPDVEKCFEEDAKWAYFMTWDNFYQSDNSLEHLQYTYNHELVITLDERNQTIVVENQTVQTKRLSLLLIIAISVLM